MTNNANNTRHATRMARKKALIDAAIARNDKEQGLLLVLTGNGLKDPDSAVSRVDLPVEIDGTPEALAEVLGL